MAAAQLLFGPTIASIKALEIVAVAAGGGGAPRARGAPRVAAGGVVGARGLSGGDALRLRRHPADHPDPGAPSSCSPSGRCSRRAAGPGAAGSSSRGWRSARRGMIKQTALFEAIGLVVLASVARRDGGPARRRGGPRDDDGDRGGGAGDPGAVQRSISPITVFSASPSNGGGDRRRRAAEGRRDGRARVDRRGAVDDARRGDAAAGAPEALRRAGEPRAPRLDAAGGRSRRGSRASGFRRR